LSGQRCRTNISPAVSVSKKKGAVIGRAAAQAYRPLKKLNQVCDPTGQSHARRGAADCGEYREAVALADVRYAAHFGLMADIASLLRWAMYGRRPRCKRNLTFCEAFGCSHVSGLFSNGGVTSIAMQPLWLLALM